MMRRLEEISGESSDDNGISLRQDPDQVLDHDITTDILERLPAKSLARFLCVSSLWASTIRSQTFIKSFLARSSKRPSLLFILPVLDNDKLYFFSSPQNSNQESYRVTNHDISPIKNPSVIECIRGLICFKTNPGIVIYNPSTRKVVTLPDMDLQKKNKRSWEGYFGYDPIEDKFKVLRVTSSGQDVHVITLGDQEWRRLHDCPLHNPSHRSICINGVVYYEALINSVSTQEASVHIVSFDVRSEKFKLIKPPRSCFPLHFINYEGKLALSIKCFVDKYSPCLWILEDAEEPQWSLNFFVFPHSLRIFLSDDIGSRILAKNAGEVIFESFKYFNPFYILYYNPQRQTIRRVELKGILHCNCNLESDFNKGFVSIFLDHVENIMFL